VNFFQFIRIRALKGIQMKIGVSTEDLNIDARVAPRFGISPYPIIVDLKTMEFEAAPNLGASDQRAAGMQTVVLAISKKVDAVLAGYCSPTAMKYLTENGIEVITGLKGV
jgi:predicted Fe-Mo cluster-binding NifX family protein